MRATSRTGRARSPCRGPSGPTSPGSGTSSAVTVDPAVLGRAVLLWSVLFGAVSLEVFGQFGTDTFTQLEPLFEHQIRLTLATLRG